MYSGYIFMSFWQKIVFPHFTWTLEDTVCGHRSCAASMRGAREGKCSWLSWISTISSCQAVQAVPTLHPNMFQPLPRPRCLAVQVGEVNCAHGVHGKPFPSSAPGKSWSEREKSSTCSTVCAPPFYKSSGALMPRLKMNKDLEIWVLSVVIIDKICSCL